MAIQFKEYFKGDTTSQSNITFREFSENAMHAYTTLIVNNSSSWPATLNIYKMDTTQTDFYVDDILQLSSTTSGSQGIPLSITSGTHTIKIDGGSFYFDSYCLGSNYNTCLRSTEFGSNYGMSIGDRAFEDCTSLTSITIPNSVTSIGMYAFARCTDLNLVTIESSENSTLSIGMGAFHSCSSITSITIPNSVTIVGRYAFYNCSSLISMTFLRVNPPMVTSDTFSGMNECPIYVPAESVELYKSHPNWSAYASRIFAIQ